MFIGEEAVAALQCRRVVEMRPRQNCRLDLNSAIGSYGFLEGHVIQAEN